MRTGKGCAGQRLGFLHSRRTRASELFEFEYAAEALAEPLLGGVRLDPHLHASCGHSILLRPETSLGSSMIRVRTLGTQFTDRRFEREKRAGLLPADARLYESDYLLGVHDQYRVGALRYRLEDEGGLPGQPNRHGCPTFYRNSCPGEG